MDSGYIWKVESTDRMDPEVKERHQGEHHDFVLRSRKDESPSVELGKMAQDWEVSFGH